MAHGGKRDNAGRPKTKLSRSGNLKMSTAEEILGQVDEKLLWLDLLNSEDRRIRMDALKYLTDRRDGKAVQKVGGTGDSGEIPIRLFHSIPRPERTQ